LVDAGKLTLTVVTPERAILQNVSCDEVTLPEESGEIGVLPGHTPLIALLGIGVVAFRAGAKKGAVAVREGFVEVAGDVVRILADEATAPEAVDRAAVTKQKEAAEARRLTVGGEEELDLVNAEVAFAEARLKLAAA
jgi:F-type H+-transporting ATPase subunit epsilon